MAEGEGEKTEEKRHHKPGGKHRPTVVIARQREAQALELRRWGATYASIGEKLGISEVAALKAVERALIRLDIESEPAKLVIRKQEIDRLDALSRAIAPKLLVGDLMAVDRALRIQERRAKLLALDAPPARHPDVQRQEDEAGSVWRLDSPRTWSHTQQVEFLETGTLPLGPERRGPATEEPASDGKT